MGANEKHAATYHGGEYTPDTQRVRHAYVDHLDFSAQTFGLTSDDKFAIDSFNRWLEAVRAEAKAEALEEAAHALDSATINIEMLNGDPDLKQAWAFRGSERKSIIRSLRIRADRHKETP